MTLEALTQFVSKNAVKKNKIIVGGQEFKLSTDIKIFINGKTVEAKDVQNELKTFSAKEIDLLKKQLNSVQKYSGVYGPGDEIERNDFERYDVKQGKKDGVTYQDDDIAIKLGCANGKFELYW